MPVVIDTYNVLHVVGVLPPDLAGLDVHGLASLIEVGRYGRQKVRLICDGTPVESDHSGGGPKAGGEGSRTRSISIEHAGPGREADDLIRQIVSRSSAPKRLLVVTSDRAVRDAARKRRCSLLDSPTFLRHLAADAAKAIRRQKSPRPIGTLSPQQIEQWIAQFNLTEEELAIPSSSEPAAPSSPRSPKRAKRSQRKNASKESSDGAASAASEAADELGVADVDADLNSQLDADDPLPREVIDEARRLLDGSNDDSEHKRKTS